MHLLALLFVTTTTCQLIRPAAASQSETRPLDEAIDQVDFWPTRAPRRLGLEQPSGRAAGQQAAELAGQSAKFTRINELDVFLDQMSSADLGQAVSGRPLGSSPFPAPAAGSTPFMRPPIETNSVQDAREAGERAASQQLATSQSQDTLIYSECALILQRTYVKNVNDPK